MKNEIIDFLEWLSAGNGESDIVKISYEGDREIYSLLNWTDKVKIVEQYVKEKTKIQCPRKINGVCQNHNLFCSYPKCEGR